MIERQPDQTPVRVVEADWDYDRTRYVALLPWLNVFRGALIPLYLQVPVQLALRHWTVGFGFLAIALATDGFLAAQRRRAIAFVRAQVRPIDPGLGEIGLVAITFSDELGPYANDVGVLSVADGVVAFEGSQCRFCLSPGRWRPVGDQALGSFRIESDDWPGRRLSFVAIPRVRGLRDLELPQWQDFAPPIRDAMAQEAADDAIVAVPPLRALLPARARARALRVVTIAGTCLAGAIGSVLVALRWAPILFWSVAAVLGFAACVFGFTARNVIVRARFYEREERGH